MIEYIQQHCSEEEIAAEKLLKQQQQQQQQRKVFPKFFEIHFLLPTDNAYRSMTLSK